MRYLVATDSVHTTAAAADYLEPRLGPDDEVTVLAVAEGRDAGDALNVARARLAAVGGVETERRTGDPAAAILAAADEHGADVLVLGARSGRPGAAGERGADVGTTARRVLGAADVPAVVVPLPDLE